MLNVLSRFFITSITVVVYALLLWLAAHLLVVLGPLFLLFYPLLHWLVPSLRIVRRPMKFMAFIAVLTCVSLALVYLEFAVLRSSRLLSYRPDTSFMLSNANRYRIGELIVLPLEIYNIEQPINAVQIDLSFDPQKVQILRIDVSDSFAQFFLQQEIDNAHGWLRVSGGLAGGGFQQERGLFATVYLIAKSHGVTELVYLPSSLILANDGLGSNVLRRAPRQQILILPEQLSREEAKMQQARLSTWETESTAADEQLVFCSQLDDSRVLGAVDDGRRFLRYVKLLEVIYLLDSKLIGFWHAL